MRKVLSLIFSVHFLFSLPSVFGVEGDILDNGPAQHSLVADVVACNGKDSFEIAWRIRRQSGWHTYWLHPGDVGIPPSITWELPEGVTTTPLIFPAPKRVMMGEVGAHGHHGETLFLSKISFSDSFTPGDNLTIRGKAAWLTCSQTCLPGFGELVLSLPIQPNNQADPVWSARFAQFRAVLPVSPPDGWQALAYDEGSKLRMVLPAEPTASSPGVYFFSEGRTIKSDAMQPVRVKGGQWELQMTRSAWSSKQETHLRGLLYRKAGWQGDPACQFYQVSLPLAKK